ncbi:hypothetical protein M388_00720 [Mesotoga sp. Brook.08.YT.4.2.5.4.]|nr:hypothetical protein M388_00720 [Mesotoga sp. Brook.08.YT.4.2.5.4.]
MRGFERALRKGNQDSEIFLVRSEKAIPSPFIHGFSILLRIFPATQESTVLCFANHK